MIRTMLDLPKDWDRVEELISALTTIAATKAAYDVVYEQTDKGYLGNEQIVRGNRERALNAFLEEINKEIRSYCTVDVKKPDPEEDPW